MGAASVQVFHTTSAPRAPQTALRRKREFAPFCSHRGLPPCAPPPPPPPPPQLFALLEDSGYKLARAGDEEKEMQTRWEES